ncbi:MAG: hypothetical protein ACREOE_07450, partial [Gemmatimonadales bacterium]
MDYGLADAGDLRGDLADFLLLERGEVQRGLTEGLRRRATIGNHSAAHRVPLDERHRVAQVPGELGRSLT